MNAVQKLRQGAGVNVIGAKSFSDTVVGKGLSEWVAI